MSSVGIESYDAAVGGQRLPKGERDAVAHLISDDELVIRRFWGFKLDDESGTVADFGVAFIVSDRQLLVLKEGGMLKKKFKTWTFPYGQLKPNVARTEFAVTPGARPYFVTGFARARADTACLVTFHEERERDAFAAVLQAAIDATVNGVTFSKEDLDQLRSLLS